MAKDQTLLGMLQARLGIGSDKSDVQAIDELEAALTAATSELTARAESLSAVNATLATQTEAMVALELRLGEADNYKAEVVCRLQEAAQSGVSAEVALAMVQADSSESASALVLEAKASTGGTIQTEEAIQVALSKDDAEMAFAKAFAKKHSV